MGKHERRTEGIKKTVTWAPEEAEICEFEMGKPYRAWRQDARRKTMGTAAMWSARCQWIDGAEGMGRYWSAFSRAAQGWLCRP